MNGAFDPFSISDEDKLQIDDVRTLMQAVRLEANLKPDVFSGTFASSESMVCAIETPSLFPQDPMSRQGNKEEGCTVHVNLNEVLTSLYDERAGSLSLSLEGLINVRFSGGRPFTLNIIDQNHDIEKLIEDAKFCIKVSKSDEDLAANKALRVFLCDSLETEKVASYTCSPHVRPIPLLVKTKVRVEGPRCQVGVKIRSNPSNHRPLCKIVIIMAVPPDVKGDTVKLTKRNGIWDGMKRIILWQLPSLQPGELSEFQAQFQFVNPDLEHRIVPSFPVIVRCDALQDQFSDIRITLNGPMDSHNPLIMSLTKSVRVLHRKN